MYLWMLVGLVVLITVPFRLVPSDPARWHTDIEADRDKTFKKGVIRIVPLPPGGLARVDEVIRATPRTRVIAGSVPEGHITYVTRSLVFGFPDYATVQSDAERLGIYARSRFGGSDVGVNRARVEGWIDALQAR